MLSVYNFKICSISGFQIFDLKIAVFTNVVKNRAQVDITRKVNISWINLLIMIRRGEVLSAWRSSITRIGTVQSVLSEKSAIVLVHSARSNSRTFR